MPNTPWPSRARLEAVGFVGCKSEGCRVMLDPVNVPGGYCREHHKGILYAEKRERENRAA